MLGFVIPLPLGNLQGAISIIYSVVLWFFVSVSFPKHSLGRDGFIVVQAAVSAKASGIAG